jgi:hypothetical protein
LQVEVVVVAMVAAQVVVVAEPADIVHQLQVTHLVEERLLNLLLV